ncbi:HNH endonuclease [Pseudomonas oryzihabitans]|uniref:HNH endonuclease n=1 Tax=Pseudomonas oryzihabitans TaxID=47885 RepID=UPI001DB123F9|nr:HNH endonuclease [Pseudomonas oryzihabitans]HJE69861.1 HNH endonuclease [Pseudomonas oryzihabitans]
MKRAQTKTISVEVVKEMLSYDPDSGVFTWKVSRGRSPAGAIAGTKHARGYVVIKINKKDYLAHRLAWLLHTGKMPTSEIDHINGVTSDNRIANLRDVSHRENLRNTSLFRTNRSGHPGVRFVSRRGHWIAEITNGDSAIYLGSFKTMEEARDARKKAEEMLGYHPNHGRAA